MTNINKIFKIKEKINYTLHTPDRQSQEQTEDYAVKKNINTQEGTIEKVPVNDNDITNKAYVDSHSGTAGGTSIHSELSNLAYASSGHTGFASTAPVVTNTAFRTTPSTVITAGDNLSWTGNTLNAVTGTAGGTSDHAALSNLTYASAGHTGFAEALGGDDNYVTDIEKGNLHASGSDDQDLSSYYSTSAGTFNLDLPDNTEHPFYIGQGGVGYLCANTEDGSEYVQFGCAGLATPILKVELAGVSLNKDTTVTGDLAVSGSVDGIADLNGAVTANNDKVSFDWDYDYGDLINNPTTISGGQASAITANTAKVSYTGTASDAVALNTAKISYIGTASTQLAAVVASAHAQNTDTALGVSCLSADHGTAATDMIVNVCYGTSATPPTANTTTIGSLYVQYTA